MPRLNYRASKGSVVPRIYKTTELGIIDRVAGLIRELATCSDDDHGMGRDALDETNGHLHRMHRLLRREIGCENDIADVARLLKVRALLDAAATTAHDLPDREPSLGPWSAELIALAAAQLGVDANTDGQ